MSRAAVLYPFPNLRELGWGNSLRASLLVRYLAERADGVEVVCPGPRPATERLGNVEYRQLASPAWRGAMQRWRLRATRVLAGSHAAFARGVVARFDEPRHLRRFEATIAARLGASDVAFVEYPFWMPSVAPIALRLGVPLVLSLYDVHALAHESAPATAAEIARRELAAVRLADAVFCASAEDRAYLAKRGIDARVVINPIDVGECRPADEEAVLRFRRLHDLGTGPLCMFVGSRILPNLEAVEALERIAPSLPECTVVIAGRCVQPGRRANVAKLGWLDGDELRALYATSSAVVMPLASGTGTSLKFVEALAYGKAIVATTVAARGYDAEHGVHAHVVEGPDDVASGVRAVLANDAYRARLEASARRLATRYDFREVFAPYGAWLRPGRSPVTAGAVR